MAIPRTISVRNQTILEIIKNAGKPVIQKPTPPAVTYPPDEIEGDIRYVLEKHDQTDNIDSVLHLGLNDDLIWPGNLIQGNQVCDFVYIPISLPRSPLKISISAEGSPTTGSAITEIVTHPSLSNMRQGIANLLKKAIGPTTKLAAKADFMYEEVFSESHMNARFGLAASYGVGSLKTNFDWNSKKQRTKLVAKYTQPYFSVDVDLPTCTAEIFDPSTPVSAIQAALPPGSLPLYVSSVTYGMMAFICIETDESFEEMKMALEAECSGTVHVEGSAEFLRSEKLKKSSIRTIVYGGSTAGLNSIENEYDGFLKVIHASNNYSPDSPGVPISYRFRNLGDQSLTFIALTSNYTLRKPLRIRQKVNVKIDRMICTESDDEGVNNDADMDRFSISVSAFNAALNKTITDPAVKKGPGEITLLPIPIEDPVIYNWASPGWVTVYKGYQWVVDRSKEITFNTDPDKFDFSKATLIINAYGREYDSSSANESGTGQIKLTGSEFLENGGVHTFSIDSSDFRFDVNVTITLGDD